MSFDTPPYSLISAKQTAQQFMAKPVRVSLLRSVFPNCTFDVPPCRLISLNHAVFSELIVSIVQPEGFNSSDVRYVPATGYSTSVVDEMYNTTVLGLVDSGLAEMTDYIMALT